jgi:hypothetical protein
VPTLLEKVRATLDQGLPARSLKLDKEAAALLKPLCLMTMKPTRPAGVEATHELMLLEEGG